MHAITEAMRKEVSGSNVRISVIAPAITETELLTHTTDEQIVADYNETKKQIERGMDVSQVADCAEFIYNMPQEVCIREIVLAKTKQAD